MQTLTLYYMQILPGYILYFLTALYFHISIHVFFYSVYLFGI